MAKSPDLKWEENYKGHYLNIKGSAPTVVAEVHKWRDRIDKLPEMPINPTGFQRSESGN